MIEAAAYLVGSNFLSAISLSSLILCQFSQVNYEVRRLVTKLQLSLPCSASSSSSTAAWSSSVYFHSVFFGQPGSLRSGTSVFDTQPNVSLLYILFTCQNHLYLLILSAQLRSFTTHALVTVALLTPSLQVMTTLHLRVLEVTFFFRTSRFFIILYSI